MHGARPAVFAALHKLFSLLHLKSKARITMCGITGFVSQSNMTRDESCQRIETMTGTLHHRGPDGSDHWVDEHAGVALGHRRLAILDLSEAGRQPMHSSCSR